MVQGRHFKLTNGDLDDVIFSHENVTSLVTSLTTSAFNVPMFFFCFFNDMFRKCYDTVFIFSVN